jgi:hypothetical protein
MIIQSGCNAPDTYKNAGRSVFLQPVPQSTPVPLSPLRSDWSAVQTGDFWTFSDHGGNFLSVDAAGTVVDTFPVDDGSGRQRWVLEPTGDGGTRIRNFAGMTPGAPRYLARMGNLKTRMRADGKDKTCRWLTTSTPTPTPPAPTPKPPTPTPTPTQKLAARDVLLSKRGRPLKLLRESAEFCVYADVDPDGQLQPVADSLQSIWATYLGMGFRVKDSVRASQGWDAYKKPAYLAGTTPPGPCGGCPESGHGYEYQGWDDHGHAFMCTGGYGAKGGCVAHELGHLMQVATGGFGYGGMCPWAWESGAQFMRWHGCPTEEDSESLKPWLQHHATSIERHDGSACCHQYGSWLWWIVLDGEFGAGTTARAWNECAAPETPLETCARIVKVPLPDLFARWVGCLLTQKHTRAGERWARVNAVIGHSAGWNTFDKFSETPKGYASAAPLERNAFHALRLSDGKARGVRTLRLDCAIPEARMVVVVDGKVACAVPAGAPSPAVPLAKTWVAITITGPTTTESHAYAIAVQ